MKLKNICIITDGYPSEHYVINTFVETLVNAISDTGINCYVIAPQSVSKAIKNRQKLLPYRRTRLTASGNEVVVYSPKYVSTSAATILSVNMAEITLDNFRNAAEKAFGRLITEVKPDVVYGHFIFPSGITANYLGQKYSIPSFFAYGENTTYTIDRLGDKKTRELLKNITGVISVSSENKRVLTKKAIAPENRIGVFPNSVDTRVFYPKDRTEMRRKLGFPSEAFIIAFVGRFLDVKGPNRLSAAIEALNDEEIYSFFIGDGPEKPSCENILFCAPMQHENLSDYLSAADIFVLPTKAEGCCNAIIEAMACGLPVVSSKLPFNDDILTPEYSVMVDPTDIDAIENAIRTLKSDSDTRSRMSAAALKAATGLTIDSRANRILDFIESSSNKTDRTEVKK